MHIPSSLNHFGYTPRPFVFEFSRKITQAIVRCSVANFWEYFVIFPHIPSMIRFYVPNYDFKAEFLFFFIQTKQIKTNQTILYNNKKRTNLLKKQNE